MTSVADDRRRPVSHAFDRMLLRQAIQHGLTVITPDEALRQYPVRTAW